MRYSFSILLFFSILATRTVGQTVIKMKRDGGVSTIPCKVNGLNLTFIFDTGASDVSISMAEATFMLKNGYLNEIDILGSNKYLDAVGNINEGIIINMRELEIAGFKLINVKASVVKNNKAPLLLGQSAIGKLGKIQLDLEQNTLTILSGKGFYDFSKEKQQSQTSTIFQNETFINSIIGNAFRIEFIEVAEHDFPSPMVWDAAKRACSELGDGWRLPTQYELNLLYQNKLKIGGFTNNTYWSSTESDDKSAWYQHFSYGGQASYNNDKEDSYYVRAIRFKKK
jgi:hypothetical protein